MTGIYLHIPFCRSRCSYCDFATGAFDERRAEDYVAALITELDEFPRHQPFVEQVTRDVETIYFGGGTPSLLSAKQIARLVEVVHRNFDIAAGAEITLEINPATVDTTKARELRNAGINRASFGAQTFNDRDLKRLGRAHDSRAITETFETLRAVGFANINFDLIAGLPEQTVEDWHTNLRQAIALRPEHLSLYLLELHPATPLAAHIAQHRFNLPHDDDTAQMYRMLIDEMLGAGYIHYEISNFCREGFESRHNSKYWGQHAVYGFGCSAQSFDGARVRWANTRAINAYIQLLENDLSPLVEVTELSIEDLRAEHIFLGLRLMRGISLRDHQTRFEIDIKSRRAAELARLQEAGLVKLNDDTLRLTGAGALMSNEVFTELI